MTWTRVTHSAIRAGCFGGADQAPPKGALPRRALDQEAELGVRKMRTIRSVEKAQFDRPAFLVCHASNEIALNRFPTAETGINPKTHIFDKAFRFIRHYRTPHISCVVNEL
jgi:hypothetical protein